MVLIRSGISVARMVTVCGLALAVLAACGKSSEKKAVQEAPAPSSADVQIASVDPTAEFLSMAERHGAAFLREFPEGATGLGVSEDIAGEGYQSRLGGYGFEAHQRMRSLNEQFLQELRDYERSKLSGTALVTYDVLKNAYETAARRNQFDFGGAAPAGGSVPAAGSNWAISPYLVTQLTGPHLSLPQMMLNEHKLDSAQAAEDYVSRLNDFGRAFDEIIETVGSDAALGITPPRFAIEGVMTSLSGFTSTAPAENPMATHFAQSIDEIEGLTEERRQALIAEVEDAIGAVVYPAYQRLHAQFDSLLLQTDDNAGVWRLGPEGEAFYQLALNAYGAAGMTGDDVHELGLQEVARISDEMDEILRSEGLTDGSVADRMEQLAAQSDNLYPNTDEGRAALLESLREQVAAINALAPDWFGALPSQEVEVRRIPVYEQDSAPGGYYSGPSLDGSRPGSYWINLKNTADNPKHSLPTLTYHEAVPGHHFQISLQRSIKDMPLIRNMISYSEYTEGWALYGEKLAKEMGMYDNDPVGDLGRLQAEIFRAARLVVDSGIHHKQWTREQAIDYMAGVTGETRASVTREIERYAVVPGQATSYKLGMIQIGKMRAHAEQELGDDFDIRAFHDQVLLSGAMPIPVLRKRIDAWIDKNNQ